MNDCANDTRYVKCPSEEGETHTRNTLSDYYSS